MSLREGHNMKVFGLIVTTGNWVSVAIGVDRDGGEIITEEMYRQIVSTANGTLGEIDLDPSRQI